MGMNWWIVFELVCFGIRQMNVWLMIGGTVSFENISLNKFWMARIVFDKKILKKKGGSHPVHELCKV